MEFRTIYSTRSEDSQTKKAKTFEKFSKTDQRFRDETDVNMILARYRVTGDKVVLGKYLLQRNHHIEAGG